MIAQRTTLTLFTVSSVVATEHCTLPTGRNKCSELMLLPGSARSSWPLAGQYAGCRQMQGLVQNKRVEAVCTCGRLAGMARSSGTVCSLDSLDWCAADPETCMLQPISSLPTAAVI